MSNLQSLLDKIAKLRLKRQQKCEKIDAEIAELAREAEAVLNKKIKKPKS